ncbi:ShlB/FhaC/HecB family hemolysin secretion/activation protein [Trichothermofontia sp.]
MRKLLPPDWQHRLPPEMMTAGNDRVTPPYLVNASLPESSSANIISLFTCPGEPEFCLIGSIYIDDRRSPFAQEVLSKHQSRGTPVLINPELQGYLIYGPQAVPPNLLASLMWEQGNQVIAIRALAQERQNMLRLATAIADNLIAHPKNNAIAAPLSHPESPTLPDENLVAAVPPAMASSVLQDFVNAEFLNNRFSIREDMRLYSSSPDTGPPETESQYPISTIHIEGNTVLHHEIEAIRQDALQQLGSRASVQELRAIAEKITELYIKKHYITSNAELDESTLTRGEPVIRVIEGRLGKIDITGESRRVSNAYIESRIRLGAGFPFHALNAEEQLQILKNDPLFKHMEASLRRADAETDVGKVDESEMQIYVQEANPFEVALRTDNYSPPSVGSERFGIELKHRNLTGIGDELRGSVNVAVGDSQVYDISYRAPINPLQGTIQLRALFNKNSIVQDEFGELGIRGQSNLYELSYRQPLVRKLMREFALSAGFTYQGGQTFIFNDYGMPFGIGPDEDGISRTSAFSFGQDFLSRDAQGAWFFQSQFEIGTGLFNATVNEHPVPDGRFFSWFAQAQRLQQLGNNNLLLLRGAIQLTPNSLLPSQQFVIGGGELLRGYRQNARIGDNGFLFTLEDQITLSRNAAGESTFKLAPFVDLGAIWNHPDNPNWLPRQTFLASIGAGLYWEMFPRMSVRLDYGYPLVKLDDRGHNLQDSGIYFGIQYKP